MKIPFNKPFLTGKETQYIEEAVMTGKISGNGMFTQRCQALFETQFGFKKCLLTTSCTDALEMAALLLNIEIGDEVILPSYTFVSTANAFVLRGAKLVFADSRPDHPGMDERAIEKLISPKTKAIVVVHYAGVACDMQLIMALAEKHNLFVVEDAAQAIDASYKNRPLGGIGHLAAFSFHETKNIQCGEGGMLVVNDERFAKRAEILWEKGTNRAAFFKGEVDKYGWVDMGSSFLPSEIVAAFLYAQVENLEKIQTRRKQIWNTYFERLQPLALKKKIELPFIPDYASNNGHMFYLKCQSEKMRSELIEFLKGRGIHSVFHYLSLHKSPFYEHLHGSRTLPWADHYSECLLRLPFYYELGDDQQSHIITAVLEFFDKEKSIHSEKR